MTDKLMGRAFTFLWLSETAFDLGSALMGFALGVWVFERTGSGEQFAYTILSAAIPALIISPFAGTLADRFDRRWVIATCDLLAAFLVVVLAGLLFLDRLVVEHLYFFNAVGAIVGTIRNPSYQAAVSVIVPKDKLTQANGLIGLSEGVLQIFAPLAAGYLMASAGLRGIILIDLFMVAGGALAVFAALSHAKHAIRGTQNENPPAILKGMADSFSAAVDYFRTHLLMAGLLLYAVLQEGLLILVSAMVTPLVLSTHSSDTLGIILTSGALGGLAGSILLTVMKVNTRLMIWVLVTDAVLSLFVMLAGFTTSPLIWSLCAFFAMFAGSASGACAGALWMRKTPKEKQGSIFALVNALNLVVLCVVMLVGGMVGQHVLEPALAVGGVWADSIGYWVGTGPGRGYGFLFVLAGAICTVISLLALTQSRLRRLDELVSDHDTAEEVALDANTVVTVPT